MTENPGIQISFVEKTLDDYVDAIKNLPTLIIEDFQTSNRILLETESEQKMINTYKKAHKWLGKWLEFYLLNKTYNLIELKNSKEGSLYKPRADAVVSIT
jgi:hypothetical protein